MVIKNSKRAVAKMRALAEYETMKTHPEKYKRYSNFAELLKDVENET